MKQAIKKLSEPKVLLASGVFYTLFILVASLMPTSEFTTVSFPLADKLAHVLMYGLLSLLWLLYASATDKYHFPGRIVWLTLTLCFLYGVIIEATQHWFTVYRQFDLFDIVANGIGGLIGFLSFWMLKGASRN